MFLETALKAHSRAARELVYLSDKETEQPSSSIICHSVLSSLSVPVYKINYVYTYHGYSFIQLPHFHISVVTFWCQKLKLSVCIWHHAYVTWQTMSVQHRSTQGVRSAAPRFVRLSTCVVTGRGPCHCKARRPVSLYGPYRPYRLSPVSVWPCLCLCLYPCL